MYRINPALHRYKREAQIIGRLVVAFGELEYLLAVCAGRAVKERARVLKALYSLRATSSRIDSADALIRPSFDGHLLSSDYETMMIAIRYCLRIRNQFAHCNWGDDPTGLYFVDLEAASRTSFGLDFLPWRHIDTKLLRDQEAFFVNTQSYLFFFEHQLSVIEGQPIYPAHPKPSELVLPPLHNPPEKHLPTWLTADQKNLHLKQAQAAKGGDPTPTPAQVALEKARAEKKAKKQAQRDANAKSRSTDN